MAQKGLLQILILIIVVTIVLITLYFLRSLYERNTADFGTWSDFATTVCDNEGKPCTTVGTAQKYRICTPNARTGYGCVDTKGNHTYRNEVIKVECTPSCYSSVWSSEEDSPCQVYSDQSHNTLAPIQTCRLPSQFEFKNVHRTCIARDSTGPSACLKTDGSIASVGESEAFWSTCSSIPDCYDGVWATCPAPGVIVSENCGGTTTECGEVIPTTTGATCLVNGVPAPSSHCYPPDDPGPCPILCFNYPCSAWPAGFSNVSSLLGTFVEIFSGSNAIEPNWNHILINCSSNPIATNNTGSSIVITTPAPHGIPVGEWISIAGVTGTVHGIPASSINGLRQITATTSTTLTVVASSSATSTGTGGGSGVTLEQDPQAAAQNKQDVFGLYGSITTQFANNGLGTRVRFQMIPSQAEVPNGAFYLIGHLPYSGQSGIVNWNGSSLVLDTLPTLISGQTFDDVLPRPDLFKFTEPSSPQKLALYNPSGPTLTDLFCGVPACLTISSCTSPIDDVNSICV